MRGGSDVEGKSAYTLRRPATNATPLQILQTRKLFLEERVAALQSIENAETHIRNRILVFQYFISVLDFQISRMT